ncbi:MAG TPA: FtsQ-type POTRA domain-containing protein [Gemmatimonadaceae bacterium]|nr:FtsQ-type POTRA domain-containing protein [Gemmatimonadaceae bacterium]
MTEPLARETEAPVRGRRWARIAVTVLLLLLLPASWLARRGAAKLEFFHLRTVAVEGTRYLSPESVIERLAVDTLRSVWDDTEPLAARLRTMPQVGEVTIRRKLPGTLVVSIRENLPVALAASPRGLEPVDDRGVVLPIDPTRDDLDLPIVAARDERILSLLGDARANNAVLFHRISEVARDGHGGLVIFILPTDWERGARAPAASGDSLGGSESPSVPAMLRVRAALGVSAARLADIFPVESDLLRRRAHVAELDLRYRDQVIARLQ